LRYKFGDVELAEIAVRGLMERRAIEDSRKAHSCLPCLLLGLTIRRQSEGSAPTRKKSAGRSSAEMLAGAANPCHAA
jgi:hypothetical protein